MISLFLSYWSQQSIPVPMKITTTYASVTLRLDCLLFCLQTGALSACLMSSEDVTAPKQKAVELWLKALSPS